MSRGDTVEVLKTGYFTNTVGLNIIIYSLRGLNILNKAEKRNETSDEKFKIKLLLDGINYVCKRIFL
jgi:hypothetical protein